MAKQSKNSGQFQKGQPSPNPFGRAAPYAKKAQATGSDGVISYGGFLQTGERSGELVGKHKWIDYANAYTRPPVAIAALLRNALFAGSTWTLNPNDSGGRDAKKGVDIIQRGLLDARMPKPWPIVVCKAGMAWFEGFSLQAAAIARRPDGLVTFTEISERPAHTIWRWLRSSPTDPFTDVEQRLDTGETYQISLGESFYIVNDGLTASPEGVGMLRLIIERVRRMASYEMLEGAEVFSGMGGTPIARAPLEEIGNGLTGSDEEKLAKKKAKTQNIEKIVSDRIKTPDKRQYAVLDSATFQGSDPNTISGIKKWDIEILKGDLQGLSDVRKIITDGDLDIARMLGVDFVFGGGSGSIDGGAGRHASQVSLFASVLSADLAMIGVQGTQQLCRRLIAANGLDPDTATPTLVPSPISTEDVLKTTNALVQLSLAGLAPNHPAKKAIFDRLNLPWEDEAEPVLPRAPAPPSPPPLAGKDSKQNDNGDNEDAADREEQPGEEEPAKP